MFKDIYIWRVSLGPEGLDDEPHLLVRNTLAKNFSYVISTERLCLIHYGSHKLEYRKYDLLLSSWVIIWQYHWIIGKSWSLQHMILLWGVNIINIRNSIDCTEI